MHMHANKKVVVWLDTWAKYGRPSISTNNFRYWGCLPESQNGYSFSGVSEKEVPSTNRSGGSTRSFGNFSTFDAAGSSGAPRAQRQRQDEPPAPGAALRRRGRRGAVGAGLRPGCALAVELSVPRRGKLGRWLGKQTKLGVAQMKCATWVLRAGSQASFFAGSLARVKG